MILHEEGFRGMYRGLGPLILGYLPTWMVYFTVYEKVKSMLDTSMFVCFLLQHTSVCLNYIADCAQEWTTSS